MRNRTVLLGWGLLLVLGFAPPVAAEGMPEIVEHREAEQQHSLRLTGVSDRKILGRDIYTVASYCQQDHPLEKPEDLLAAQPFKQLHIRLTRPLPSALVAKLTCRVIEKVDDESQHRVEIERLQDFLKSANFEEGDLIKLTHRPQVGLTCQINDNDPLMVEKPTFSQLVWRIYFGPEPPVGERVKRELSSRVTQQTAAAEARE